MVTPQDTSHDNAVFEQWSPSNRPDPRSPTYCSNGDPSHAFWYLLQSENVGLCQLSPAGPAASVLIFQNQGFDRLSEFPKIREAIIVSADGCRILVDLKLCGGNGGRMAWPWFWLPKIETRCPNLISTYVSLSLSLSPSLSANRERVWARAVLQLGCCGLKQCVVSLDLLWRTSSNVLCRPASVLLLLSL